MKEFVISEAKAETAVLVGLITQQQDEAETWFRTLGWEDPLEEGMATHTSILVWRIPMDGGAWWATVRGVAKCQT